MTMTTTTTTTEAHRGSLDRPLAFLRWTLGLVVVCCYSSYLLDYDQFFSTDGLLPRVYWQAELPSQSISYFRFISSESACKAIAFAALLPMLLFWWGVTPRVNALVSWYALVSIHDRFEPMLDSGDALVRILLFLFIFARSDRWLSPLAPIIRRDAPDQPWGTTLVVRLLQIQIALLYFCAGISKALGATWRNGTALAYALQLETFSRGQPTWLTQNRYLMSAGTYATLIFELSFAALIWPRATRKYVLVAGLALHLSIELSMAIPIFSSVMIASYAIFCEPRWVERITSFALRPWRNWAKRRAERLHMRVHVQDAGWVDVLHRLDVFGVLESIDTDTTKLEVEVDGRAYVGWRARVQLGLVVPSLLPFVVFGYRVLAARRCAGTVSSGASAIVGDSGRRGRVTTRI